MLSTGGGYQLEMVRHVVKEGGSDALDTIRRECHDPRRAACLLEFVNTDTGRHVVALWVDRDAGTVADLTSWHPVAEPLSGEHIEQVLFNLNDEARYAGFQTWIHDMLDEEWSRRQRWLDDEEERRDLRESLKRKEPNLHKREDPRWLAAI